jgi:hypothetical protein
MESKGNHHNWSTVIIKSYLKLGSQYNHFLLQVPRITAMSTRFMSYLNTLNQLQHLHRLDNCFYNHPLYYLVFYDIVGRDSVVITANCYGLDGPGIESRWEGGFSDPSRPVLGPTQPPTQYAPDHSYSGRNVAWTTHPYVAPSLKKEYSYTPTTPLGIRCLL